MTDNQLDSPQSKGAGLSRAFAGAIAGGFTSWFLTWCSIHGVDFKTFGVDSELIKGGITGTLTGIFVAPDTLVFALRDFFIWCHTSFNILRQAAEQGKE